MRRWPWATTLIAALAIGAFAWPGAQSAWLIERAAVQRGELWRWWTGQLVHFGASHLGWNLAVFIVAGAWLERVDATRARIYFVLAPAVIGAVLFGFEPALEVYGGLSGLSAGALALLAITQLGLGAKTGSVGARGKQSDRTTRENDTTPNDRWFWIAVLVVVAAKIAMEVFREQAVFARFEAGDVHVVPLAHVAGVACAVAVYFSRRKRKKSAP